MAIFHRATISPTKEDLLARWAPTTRWGPSPGTDVKSIGSYRFDDPEGRVGMEVFLLDAGGVLFHVPLTYRDDPLDGAAAALITEMEHSVLGTRWVYDGLRDPRFLIMLAGVSLTGQGEALGMAQYEGRWYVAPSNVRVVGGGWNRGRVPVDEFELVSDEGAASILRSDRFDLIFHRRPMPGPRPAIGLVGSWSSDGGPVVLAEMRQR